MTSPFTEEQQRFLRLLELPVPGRPAAGVCASPQAALPKAAAAAQPPREDAAPTASPPTPRKPAIPAALASPAASPTMPDVPLRDMAAQERRETVIAGLAWADLAAMVSVCQDCPLGATRQHAVFGAGNPQGRWLFVGEAPGAEEDRRGEAFVGRAGQLLDAMLKAMGLERGRDVYIANVLKCRPPNNRDPLGPEVRECLPYLHRQIALVRPQLIVALGRFATQGLLQVDTPLNKLRGTVQHYGDIPVVITYHPAYLLRNPIDKRRVWEDLKKARQVFQEAGGALPEAR
ncbi:uracil-DNA glycosylase [Acidithiobacillus sulfuriphilus]|uniref:uracil-DNA glycosylase n=1 Tax=Acidithiobacillus sulfuriphilus TaxID=1867749 RepID=UPI003F6122A4